MVVFHVDLDNTLIYSYKHVMSLGVDRKEARGDEAAKTDSSIRSMNEAYAPFMGWINVEIYQGREISFITKKTYELLMELKRHVLIVPTTTRTNEQYGRIDLQIGNIEYALTCNGGVLLHNGKSDDAWYGQSKGLVEDSREELQKAIAYLQKEENRIFEIRWIQELFVFTKCRNPAYVVTCMRNLLDGMLVDIFSNGEKVYVVPKKLNKGNALLRFRDYIGAVRTLAAGDSIFDLPMLEQADLAAAPAGLAVDAPVGSHVHFMQGKELFSEEMLEFMLSACY